MTEADVVRETHEHVQNVQMLMAAVVRELVERSSIHDASKFKEPEFSTFMEFTPKLKGCTYGSDEYKGFLEAMKPALDHHYANNPHHPEHHGCGIRGMTLMDLVEMICDGTAATLRHADGDIRRSIEQNQERFGYSDELKQILHNTVSAIRAPRPVTTSPGCGSGRVSERASRDTEGGE